MNDRVGISIPVITSKRGIDKEVFSLIVQNRNDISEWPKTATEPLIGIQRDAIRKRSRRSRRSRRSSRVATISERHAQGCIVAWTEHIKLQLEHSGIEYLLCYVECQMRCVTHSLKQTRFIGHSISSSCCSSSMSRSSNSPVTVYYASVAIVAITMTTGKQ